MIKKKPAPSSIRNRYIKYALLFGILIIGLSIFMYIYVLNQRAKVSSELSLIDQQSERIQTLRKTLIRTYQAIDSFLLDPTAPNQITFINESLDEAITTSDSIRKTTARRNVLFQETAELTNQFKKLDTSIQELIETRLDVRRQYPGMALSAFQMGPIQDRINDQFLILNNEIDSGEFQPRSPELQPLLLKTQILWSNLISQMRIYLANRFASFSTEILTIQANSTDDIIRLLNSNLSRLKELYLLEEDSFEGSAGIETISQAVTEWQGIFSKIRSINKSSGWREDGNIMEYTIIPLTNQIAQSLNELEQHLREEERIGTTRLEKNTNHVFLMLAAIIASVIFVIIGILVSMELMIFRPILNVASALRSKALGHEVPQFSTKQSLETQYLIDAFEEMDHQIKRRQEALEHQSLHDSLTSLPNRFMLNERLDYQIFSAQRNNSPVSLLILDLNAFKDINDSLGHRIGDHLLILVSERLKLCIRDVDTLARLGGDEFAIILSETPRDKASYVAEKISRTLANPFNIDDHKVSIGVSIGIAALPEDGTNSQQLLQQADIAMFTAKRDRLDFAYYNAEEDEYSLNRIALINDLRMALVEDRLELYFQPQIDIKTRNPVGAEALLRWNHPEYGFIRPDKIIELAEDSGIINQLTNWVTDNAMRQCRKWLDAGYPLSVSINLSVQNLSNTSLVEMVRQALALHNLTGKDVVLEITENGMMTNPGRSIEVLEELHQMGVGLSVDDFGTGFSSLTYLQRLPANEVKIDKSFVFDMNNSDNDTTIVESIIDLGHNLGLRIVAEGVEHDDIYKKLEDLKCDLIQGYMISKPLPVKEFNSWLKVNYLEQGKIRKIRPSI
jgi:diguanylate cyclase